MTKHIVPRYKLMMFYDLADKHTEDYYQFVMNEMIPALQAMNVYIFRAFQTISGQQDSNHRNRQVEYVAETLEEIEEKLIRRALAHCDNVQSHAARMLGIKKNLIQHKMKKYHILVV